MARNPARAASGVGWASATAVDSSVMASAASSRTAPRARSSPASRSPYSPFRLPSSTAPAVPAARFPPAATTPASANWDAPE